jgi:hypothetical protein
MAKPEALNNLVAALRKDFEANGNGGPFQKQFFADPFCTMARFGLDADDRNCLLTMSKEVVAKYLKDASQSEGEWLEKWSGPGTGWDAEDGIPDNPIPVEEYLKCPSALHAPGNSWPTAFAASAWPSPLQGIRRRDARINLTKNLISFRILGEGLYPRGELVLVEAGSSASPRILRRPIATVYVKSIHSTHLFTADEPLDPALRGDWYFRYKNDGAATEIDSKLPAYTIAF